MKSLLVKLGVILVAIGIFCPCSSFCDQDSIWFAGTQIKIGMSKSYVLTEIARNYSITKAKGETDLWKVSSKREVTHGDIGRISFENEKVHWVGKSWGSFRKDEAIQFAKTIYSVLSKFSGEGKRTLSLDLGSIKEPRVSLDEVILIAGERRLIIMISEDVISVQENLQE